jgi:nitroreductase
MEVFEALRTLLAVRKFQDRPVPAEVIQKVVEAGRLTPSAKNGQPWHFVVVEDRATLQKLGEIATTGRYTADAAFAVVVTYEKASEFGVSDATMAVHSMMLAAWGEGVGSNWVGFANRFTELHPLLGLPESYDVLAIIPFGYSVAEIGKGIKRRKALGEVASRGRFGQPFA